MKKLLLTFILLMPLVASAASSAIHDLTQRPTPDGDERFVVDWFTGAIWRNYYLTLDQIKTFSGGTSGDPVVNQYVTQQFVTYNTNTYNYTTNLYATYSTNLYEYTTNNYTTYNTNLYEWTTNSYNTYNTNLYEYTTNLYATYSTNLYNFTTNLYATYNTNLYSYVTNLYSTYNTNEYSYITNLYSTYNTNLYSYVTNLYATYSTNLYSYITNLYATYVTNEYFYTTNISTKVLNVTEVINANTTIITNNQYFATNSWSGPTNDIDLTKADVYYDTYTPCSITGFVSKSNNVSSSVLLTLKNLASTNITLQLPLGVTTGDGSKSYTITNATTGVISMRYSPVGQTNCVFRGFW